MRIRSIKPEFWRSDDIAALDYFERILFIGLWSYCDDFGRGRDSVPLIVADLFALDDPSRTFANVSRGLSRLEKRGLIRRYEVDGKRFLAVWKWQHQKVDKPQPSRLPDPATVPLTSDDAEPDLFANDRDQFANDREAFAPVSGIRDQGTEDQGACKNTPSPQAASAFESFWAAYPRKVSKERAVKAWPKATKKASPDVIVAAARRYGTDPNLPDLNYVPHPSTWLNDGGWNNAPCLPPPIDRRPAKPTTFEKAADTMAMGADLQRQADARNGATNGHSYHLEIT